MTLIVVTDKEVLVDSIETNGNLRFNAGARKVRRLEGIPGVFAVAGAVTDLSIIVGASKSREELIAATFPCGSENRTCILWVVDGEVWVMECEKGARWYRLERTSPINFQTGAGWHWFEAYFAAYQDAHEAFKKACTLHPDCELPMNIIKIEDFK